MGKLQDIMEDFKDKEELERLELDDEEEETSGKGKDLSVSQELGQRYQKMGQKGIVWLLGTPKGLITLGLSVAFLLLWIFLGFWLALVLFVLGFVGKFVWKMVQKSRE